MAIGFQVYAVDKFPSSASFQTEEQLSLLADPDHNVEVVVTKVNRSPDSTSATIKRFDVVHDFLFELQYPGRARDIVLREFVTPYKFPAFLVDSNVLGFTPLLVRTKKKVATDFTSRLHRDMAGFKVSPTAVDLAALRPRLQLIRGACFGSMRAPNLSSTAVYGTTST